MPLGNAFLDASYAIALASPADMHHTKAAALADQLPRDRTRLITTHAVLVEIGNFLARQKYRQAAIQLLSALERDSTVEIIPLSESLAAEAFILYQQRPDKKLGNDRLYLVRGDEVPRHRRRVNRGRTL